MVKKAGNSDITFVASVFTGALATFGLTTGKNGGSKTPTNCPMVKNKTLQKHEKTITCYATATRRCIC